MRNFGTGWFLQMFTTLLFSGNVKQVTSAGLWLNDREQRVEHLDRLLRRLTAPTDTWVMGNLLTTRGLTQELQAKVSTYTHTHTKCSHKGPTWQGSINLCKTQVCRSTQTGWVLQKSETTIRLETFWDDSFDVCRNRDNNQDRRHQKQTIVT